MHHSVPDVLDATPNRGAPTEHTNRLPLRHVVHRKTEVPERTAAGVGGSFHPDIDGQACGDAALLGPIMTADDLSFRIEYRMGKSKFDVLAHV